MRLAEACVKNKSTKGPLKGELKWEVTRELQLSCQEDGSCALELKRRLVGAVIEIVFILCAIQCTACVHKAFSFLMSALAWSWFAMFTSGSSMPV